MNNSTFIDRLKKELTEQPFLKDQKFEIIGLPLNTERSPKNAIEKYVVYIKEEARHLIIVANDLSDIHKGVSICNKKKVGAILNIDVFLKIDDHEILILPYFSGVKLSTLVENNKMDEQALIWILDTLLKSLMGTKTKGSLKGAKAELNTLKKDFLSIPYLTQIDKAFFQDNVFPFLISNLTPDKICKCYTNRDIVTKNIILSEENTFKLIDYEFFSITHFFWEAIIRLKTYSSLPSTVSSFLEDKLADNYSWYEIFFWLNQIVIEFKNNKKEIFLNFLKQNIHTLIHLSLITIPDLNKSILFSYSGGLQQQLQDTRATLLEIEGELKTVSSHLASELNPKLRYENNSILSLSKKDLGRSLQELESSISKLVHLNFSNNTKTIRDDISKSIHSLGLQSDSVKKDLKRVEASVEAISPMVAEIEQKISEGNQELVKGNKVSQLTLENSKNVPLLLSHVETLKEDLKKQRKFLETEAKKQQMNLEKLKEKETTIRREIDELQSELRSKEASIVFYSGNFSELKTQYDSLFEENMKHLSDIDELRKTFGILENQIATLESQKSQLSKHLESITESLRYKLFWRKSK